MKISVIRIKWLLHCLFLHMLSWALLNIYLLYVPSQINGSKKWNMSLIPHPLWGRMPMTPNWFMKSVLFSNVSVHGQVWVISVRWSGFIFMVLHLLSLSPSPLCHLFSPDTSSSSCTGSGPAQSPWPWCRPQHPEWPARTGPGLPGCHLSQSHRHHLRCIMSGECRVISLMLQQLFNSWRRIKIMESVERRVQPYLPGLLDLGTYSVSDSVINTSAGRLVEWRWKSVLKNTMFIWIKHETERKNEKLKK